MTTLRALGKPLARAPRPALHLRVLPADKGPALALWCTSASNVTPKYAGLWARVLWGDTGYPSAGVPPKSPLGPRRTLSHSFVPPKYAESTKSRRFFTVVLALNCPDVLYWDGSSKAANIVTAANTVETV
jgi:hypothetical protein